MQHSAVYVIHTYLKVFADIGASLENHCYYINVSIDFDSDPAEHKEIFGATFIYILQFLMKIHSLMVYY